MILLCLVNYYEWFTQPLAILRIQDGVFCSHFHFLILAKSLHSRDKPLIIINQTEQNHLLLKPCYFNLLYYQRGKATRFLQILLHGCKRASGLKLCFFFFPSRNSICQSARIAPSLLLMLIALQQEVFS